MNTFHVVFKTGKERYIRADYLLPGETTWDFYDSRCETEVLVDSFPMDEIEQIVQVEEE
jgi:hypothetical protein